MKFWKRHSSKPKLCILGDHSKFHSGCKAVMRTLWRLANEKGWQIVRDCESCDALLVNGEGSMHDGSKRFHEKMNSLKQAVTHGKPAYLVNTVWQDNPHDYDDLLQQLSGIFVREVLSQKELLEKHGVQSTTFPDASFFAPLARWTIPHHFHDRPAVSDFLVEPKRINGRRNIFQRLDHMFVEAEPLPFCRWSWGKNIASLRTARYLITGRHHAVYAACVARIPFVASEGNTHKIEGLVASAGADLRVAEHPSQISEIIEENLSKPEEYLRLFDWIDRHDIGEMMPSPDEIWGQQVIAA